MKDCDRLSLVTYDSSVNLEFGLTPMDRSSKERTKAVVEGIAVGSCTNLCGGLIEGEGGEREEGGREEGDGSWRKAL